MREGKAWKIELPAGFGPPNWAIVGAMTLGRFNLAWLALPLLAGLAYATALRNPFVYDDLASIQDNAFIRQVDLAPVFLRGGVSSDGFAHGQFRPLTIASFALNYAAGGDNPTGYRLANLLLHVLNAMIGACLLRVILMRVPFSWRKQPLSEDQSTVVAILAAAIFVVHPINSLGVLLVWKRATLLLTLFSLVATLSLLALRREEPSRGPWRRLVLYGGLWGGQLLALGSKENAVLLPATLLLVDLWPRLGQQPRAPWRGLVRLQVPTLLIGIAGAVFLITRSPQKVEMGRLVYLATQAKVIWGYAAMAVEPSLVSTVYDVILDKPQDPLLWVAALSLLGLLLASAWLARRLPFVALAVFWAALALAPTSSLIPIPLLKDEDRVYLAFLLLWALPARGLLWLFERPEFASRVVARLGGALIVLVLMGFTLARASLWSDAESLWLDAVKRHPEVRTAANNYCAAILVQPDKARAAVAVCSVAHARDPENPLLQANLVTAYLGVGAVEQAEALLAATLARGEPSSQLLRLAGHVAWYRDRPAEAIGYYGRVLKEQPFDLPSVLYMARSYVDLGVVEEARSLAKQIDRWAIPNDTKFRLALAELHRAVGWVPRACSEYAELASANGGDPRTSADRHKLAAACAHSR